MLIGVIVAQMLHIALIAAAAPTLAGVYAMVAGSAGRPRRAAVRCSRGGTWPGCCASSRCIAGERIPGDRIRTTGASLPPIAVAACLVPSFALDMTFARFADLLLIAGLLALARAALALAALDAGTAPGGMAASRAMLLGVLAEPALLLVGVRARAAGGQPRSRPDRRHAASRTAPGWRTGVAIALAAPCCRHGGRRRGADAVALGAQPAWIWR